MTQLSDSAPCPSSRNRTLRVLIADDQVDAAETLAMVMSLEGHAVAIASNGESALALAAGIQPDVAILDICMPGLDGYAVAQRIRQTPWGVSCLVVALSGFGEAQDKLRAHGSGFDEHFTKPVAPSLLLGRIAAWHHGGARPSNEEQARRV